MKSVDVVGQVRQLAVEIERETAPREVERRKWEALRSLIDTTTIAQFVMGEKWTEATPVQQKAITEAVGNLVVEGLVQRLGNPMAEPFELGEARTLDNGDILVVSHVRFRDGHRGELDWRLHARDSNIAVADVLVDGASVAVGARDQATTELKSNGGSIPQLIAAMRNRLRFK